MSVRHVTAETVQKLEEWEGVVLYAYDDANGKRIGPSDRVAGTLTIGAGHTGPDVRPGQTITKAQADQLLARDLASAEATVSNAVKVDLSDRQFGALVSFCFNAGAGAFLGSTLLKKLNQGKYEAVPAELMKWTKTHINGKLVNSPGLVSRRTKEAEYWSSGFARTQSLISQQSAQPVKDGPNWFTPESISTVGAGVAGVGSVASGTGPVQIALAIVLVAAAGVALYFFIRNRLAPH